MPSKRNPGAGGSIWGGAALTLGAIVFGLLAGEIFARVADHRGIFDEATYFGTPEQVPIDGYIAAIEAGRQSVGKLWELSPPPLPNRRKPDQQDLEKLREFGDRPIDLAPALQLTTAELFKVWNSKLAADACNHIVLKPLTRWPLDLFDSPSGDDRPRYRYRPNTTLPSGLVTNQIGWRGKPVEELKQGTIRIVFVGASTIAESPHIPWSAPELVEVWLNAWAHERGLGVHFEVLNAGRDSAHTRDVAAIVRDEVVPLRPDLVIFYEGANGFDWSSVVANASSLKEMPRPQYDDVGGWVTKAVRMSSLFARGMQALDQAGLASTYVPEPAKPQYKIDWPADVDEQDPDIKRQDLPLNLNAILNDFESMRADLAKVGSDFALSSFAWLVQDGLKVDPVKGHFIWMTNNKIYWPWTYHDLRRGLDFENRAYRKYTEAHDLAFLDVASLIPAEPLLFADALHMTTSGVRVKAWAFFRELLPLVEKRLASGAWPSVKVGAALPEFRIRRVSFDCK